MRFGVGRADLGAHREEGPIPQLADIARLEGFGEARPPSARLELVERAEQRLAGHDVHVDPRLMVVPVLIMEWRLGGGVLGYLVLSRRERAAQFRFGRLLEVHWVPPFRFALGARALGGASDGEGGGGPQLAVVARNYLFVHRRASHPTVILVCACKFSTL